MAYTEEVKYFNSFWLKKVEDGSSDAVWPGVPYNDADQNEWPVYPNAATISSNNWYIEECRIKGGFNESFYNQGARAYINEENIIQQSRGSSLIHSGIYNSRTGINQTNVFSLANPITKSLDPHNGTIQKLIAEDTNLLIFQEDKVSQALIDKDAIYSAEGTPLQTTSNVVIGQIVPYLGRYGVGKFPFSVARFGFRKYFVDPIRGVVCRLSRDGITEISNYGMKDFFRDQLSLINTITRNHYEKWEFYSADVSPAVNLTEFYVLGDICKIPIGSKITNLTGNINIETNSTVTQVEEAGSPNIIKVTVDVPITPTAEGNFKYSYKQQIIGGWDNWNKYYTTSFQSVPAWLNNDPYIRNYNTLSFDDSIQGWVSFYDYKPLFIDSIKGINITFNNTEVWQHYQGNDDNYVNFYGYTNGATVTFILNNNPSVKKVFKTINYEGDNGWYVPIIASSPTQMDDSLSYIDSANVILSYDEGIYTDPDTGVSQRCGFDRKENLYVSNIVNGSQIRPNEILGGGAMTGIKGYYTTITLATDNTTDVGGKKILWSVGSEIVQSS